MVNILFLLPLLAPFVWTQSTTDLPSTTGATQSLSSLIQEKLKELDLQDVKSKMDDMLTDEKYNKFCQVMQKIRPNLTETITSNSEHVMDCAMTRSSISNCFLKNYNLEEAPKTFDEWKDVFCNETAEEPAQVLRDNIKCSIFSYSLESMALWMTPDECEDDITDKFIDLIKEVKTDFNDVYNEAVDAVYGNEDGATPVIGAELLRKVLDDVEDTTPETTSEDPK